MRKLKTLTFGNQQIFLAIALEKRDAYMSAIHLLRPTHKDIGEALETAIAKNYNLIIIHHDESTWGISKVAV